MPLEVQIRAITISDHTRLDVPATGVVALVGPNNAGKSAALRQIVEHMSGAEPNPDRPRHVVHDVEIVGTGSGEDLETWLERHCVARTDRRTGERSYRRPSAGDIQLAE